MFGMGSMLFIFFCNSEILFGKYANIITSFEAIYWVSPQKKRPTFDLMKVENDYIYTISFVFPESSYFNLEFRIKQSEIG